MSEPIRSASVSPFAAARPQVHSRRVSLRVGAFGLTYTTDRLLWEAPATPTAADPAPVDPAPAIEAERQQPQAEASTFPADLETARRLGLWASAQDQAARQQTLAGQVDGQAGRWAGGQQLSGERAAAQCLGQVGEQVGGQVSGFDADGLASGSGPLAESQAKPGEAQSGAAQSGAAQSDAAQSDAVLAGQGQAEQRAAALSDSGKTGSGRAAGTQTGRSRGTRALAQAMRHATQAYQACQVGFACPRPMLQAVA